jgi:hypothetical protein
MGFNQIDTHPEGLGGRNLVPDPNLSPTATISSAVPAHAMDPGQARTHALCLALRHEVEQAARDVGLEGGLVEEIGEVAIRAALPAFTIALRIEATYLRTGTGWGRADASIASVVRRVLPAAVASYLTPGTEAEKDLRTGAAIFNVMGPHVEFMPAERFALGVGIAAGARAIVVLSETETLRAAMEKNEAQAKASALAANTAGVR